MNTPTEKLPTLMDKVRDVVREELTLREWRDRGPWHKPNLGGPLPALAPQESDVQVFVRLNFGPMAWNCVVLLNGQAVNVPIAHDVETRDYIGLLPVPTPHVRVRWIPGGEVQPGIKAMTVEVTTE